MRINRLWSAACVVCLAIGGASAAAAAKPKKAGVAVLKIGGVLPISGAAEEFGKCNRESTELVISEYSRKSRLRIQLDIQDSKSTPKDGISAYQALMARDSTVPIISTELSSVSMSLAPRTQEAKQLLAAIAATPKLNEYKYVLRMYPAGDSLAAAFADASAKLAPAKDSAIAILYVDDEYGRSVSEVTESRLRGQGRSALAKEPFLAKEEVRGAVLNRKGASLYIVVGYGAAMGLVLRETRAVNPDAIIIASPEINFSDVLASVSLPDPRLYYVDIPAPSKSVLQLYQAKLRRKPTLVDLLVFDGLNAVLAAAEELARKGGSFQGDAIAEAMRGRTFSFQGRRVPVDQEGNIRYELILRKSESLRR